MTAIPEAPPRESSFLSDLMAAAGGTQKLAHLFDELGGRARIDSRYVVEVDSGAEVDRAAAFLGVTPGRPCCGRYQAVWRGGPVTITVALRDPGAVPPAEVVEIDAAARMALGAGRETAA